jgi:hypothetical protein
MIKFDYSRDYAWAQWECAGLSLRIGRRAWVLFSDKYRDKDCRWPDWLHFRLVLAAPSRGDQGRRWAVWVFGRCIIDIRGGA